MFESLQERPTGESIKRQAEHLSRVWEDAHTQFGRVDAFYHQTNQLWEKEPYKPQYHNSRASAIIDHAADTQMPYEPLTHRPPLGDGQSDKERADRVERFLSAVFRQAGLLEPLMPFKQAGKYLVAYGYAPMCGMKLDAGHLSARPERKKGESVDDFGRREARWQSVYASHIPFRYSAPHPGRVLMDPFEKQPPIAIVRVQKYAFDLEDITRRKANRAFVRPYVTGKADAYEPVRCLEFWSPFWHALALEGGEMLFAERNTWGFQPFMHGYAGWGLDVTAEHEMNPRYLAKGLLDPVMESIQTQQQQQTAKHEVLMRAAWLKRITTKDTHEASVELRGDILQGSAGDWNWERMPELSQSLFTVGAEVERDIVNGTYVGDVSGHRQEGVSTVGQQAILSAAAHQKFTAATQQLNHFGSIIAGRCLRLVDVLADTYGIQSVTVDGHTITPDDVRRNYTAYVTFSLVQPALAVQEKEFAMREYGAGLLDEEGYWSVARKEDATGIRRRLVMDRVRKQPRVAALMEEMALHEMGLEEEADRLAAERQNPHRSSPSPQGSGVGVQGSAGVPSDAPASPMRPDAPATALRQLRRGLSPEALMLPE